MVATMAHRDRQPTTYYNVTDNQRSAAFECKNHSNNNNNNTIQFYQYHSQPVNTNRNLFILQLAMIVERKLASIEQAS